MTQPAGSSAGGSEVGRQASEQCTQEHARGPLLAHTGVTATFLKTEGNYWSLEFPCSALLAENVTSNKNDTNHPTSAPCILTV